MLKNHFVLVVGLMVPFTVFAYGYGDDDSSNEDRSGYYQRHNSDGSSSWGQRYESNDGDFREYDSKGSYSHGTRSDNGFEQKWDSKGNYSWGIHK